MCDGVGERDTTRAEKRKESICNQSLECKRKEMSFDQCSVYEMKTHFDLIQS